MQNIISRNTVDRDGGRVVLLTRQPILAIDIEDALKSIGLSAWVDDRYDVSRIRADGRDRVRAAIVDLTSSDRGAHTAFFWLANRNIPTVVITDETDDPDTARIRKHASVIAVFSKPVIVEKMLPLLSSALER